MRIASLLLAALLICNSSHAFETSENYWEFGQAVFHVGINGSSPSGDTWNAAFIRAMEAWTDVSAFTFVAVDDYLDPCIDRGPNQLATERPASISVRRFVAATSTTAHWP